jgi:hypothetical protein
MSIPGTPQDSFRAVIEAALAEFGEELHVEAARLERAALRRKAPRPDEGGFASIEPVHTERRL